MEHTERYYESVATWLSNASIFVSTVNRILIRDFEDDSLRTPKTDNADSQKIDRYTLTFYQTSVLRCPFCGTYFQPV